MPKPWEVWYGTIVHILLCRIFTINSRSQKMRLTFWEANRNSESRQIAALSTSPRRTPRCAPGEARASVCDTGRPGAWCVKRIYAFHNLHPNSRVAFDEIMDTAVLLIGYAGNGLCCKDASSTSHSLPSFESAVCRWALRYLVSVPPLGESCAATLA